MVWLLRVWLAVFLYSNLDSALGLSTRPSNRKKDVLAILRDEPYTESTPAKPRSAAQGRAAQVNARNSRGAARLRDALHGKPTQRKEYTRPCDAWRDYARLCRARQPKE